MRDNRDNKLKFMEERNGELVNSSCFGYEGEADKSGKLILNGKEVGSWKAEQVNVRIGRSGSKVHHGIVFIGKLDTDAKISDEYGFTRMKRTGESVRNEPANLCGATSTARGGGRYANWQGTTTDEIDCKYCLKKMSE